MSDQIIIIFQLVTTPEAMYQSYMPPNDGQYNMCAD
jgi:hypothetical protein